MIRIVFFTILLLGLVFLLGDLLLRVIGWKRTIGAAVAWGVAVLLTALQFVAYPLFLLHASFSLFCVLFSVVLAALVFFSLYRLVKDKERVYAGQLRSLGRELRAHPVSAAMVLFITAAYFYRVFFYHYPDSDDAYYLARAMEAVAQNALHLDHTFIWTGLPSDALGGVTDASTFEYLKAYFSVLSGIHVSIICRTGLLLVLNLAHFGAILTAADSLDPNGHSRTPTRCLFFALYLIIQMACHLLPCSGVWMTNYLWQGKALLPGLVFPLLLAACAELFERRDCFRNIEWLSALVALTAGAAASIVGIILGPVFYVVMGLSFVIAARFRNFGKIVVCAALAALPILICAVLSYIDVATNTTRYLTDLGSLGVADWWGEYSVTAEKPQMFLLALSFLYLLLRGSKLQKVMLILPSAILLISFANPLLIHPVSSYLTTPLVYSAPCLPGKWPAKKWSRPCCAPWPPLACSSCCSGPTAVRFRWSAVFLTQTRRCVPICMSCRTPRWSSRTRSWTTGRGRRVPSFWQRNSVLWKSGSTRSTSPWPAPYGMSKKRASMSAFPAHRWKPATSMSISSSMVPNRKNSMSCWRARASTMLSSISTMIGSSQRGALPSFGGERAIRFGRSDRR